MGDKLSDALAKCSFGLTPDFKEHYIGEAAKYLSWVGNVHEFASSEADWNLQITS